MRESLPRFRALMGPLLRTPSQGADTMVWLAADRRALETKEVADATLYLLSPRSSGINAQGLVVDAGMGVNAFDERVIRRASRPEGT